MSRKLTKITAVLIAIIMLSVNSITASANDYYEEVNIDEESGLIIVSEPRRIEFSIDYTNHSTSDLIATILSDREMINCALYFDSTGKPYDVATDMSRALVELEKREEADILLYNHYFTSQEDYTSQDEHQFLRLLLSQPIFRDSLTAEQQTNLNTSLSNVLTRNGSYSTYSLITDGEFYFNHTSDTTTFSGLSIELYTATSDHNINMIQALRTSVASQYPNVTYKGPATSAYNSHSFAWYYSSTGNSYAIFDISNYINDPHTTHHDFDSWSSIEVGDILVYKKADGTIVHSALVTSTDSTSPICTSKWGNNGLYQHRPLDVPASYYADENCNSLNLDVYRLTKTHSYKVTSKNASVHTKTCSVCGDSYNEAHNVVNDRCLICGFAGPFMEGGGILAIIEDPKTTATFSRKQT